MYAFYNLQLNAILILSHFTIIHQRHLRHTARAVTLNCYEGYAKQLKRFLNDQKNEPTINQLTFTYGKPLTSPLDKMRIVNINWVLLEVHPKVLNSQLRDGQYHRASVKLNEVLTMSYTLRMIVSFAITQEFIRSKSILSLVPPLLSSKGGSFPGQRPSRSSFH